MMKLENAWHQEKKINEARAARLAKRQAELAAKAEAEAILNLLRQSGLLLKTELKSRS